MDNFDSIFNEKLNKGPNNNDGNYELLNEKRKDIYGFLSDKKTLIVLIILAANFLYNLVTTIINMFGANALAFSDVLSTIVSLALAIIIPVGFYKLHTGGKNQNATSVNSGLEWLKTYFKILKVLLIILAILFGILGIMILIAGVPGGFIILLLFAGIFWLFFFIVSLFKEYISGLTASFNSINAKLPYANKINTYLIVMLVLTIIFVVIIGFSLEYLAEAAAPILEQSARDVLAMLKAGMVSFYIQMAIMLGCQAYIIYYFICYDKFVGNFNPKYMEKANEYYQSQIE